jgi:hypothetical protein
MDIVERLREKADRKSPNLYMKQQRIETEAADEIERLREALQHIADLNPLCVGGIKVAIEAAQAALKGDE